MSNRDLRISVASADPLIVTAGDNSALAIAFLGETATLAFADLILGSITCTTARVPSGSSNTFSAGAFVTDAVGWFKFTAQNGSDPARAVHLICLPVAAKTDTRIKEPARQILGYATVADPNPRSEQTVRNILRSYYLEQFRNARDLSVADNLSTNAPLPASVNWPSFATDGR